MCVWLAGKVTRKVGLGGEEGAVKKMTGMDGDTVCGSGGAGSFQCPANAAIHESGYGGCGSGTKLGNAPVRGPACYAYRPQPIA